MKYDFAAIEKKWQDKWEQEKPYAAVTGDPRPKFYGLIEFPYPSAAGLHVGHPRPFTAMDIICRKKRMQGYNVLNPIGVEDVTQYIDESRQEAEAAAISGEVLNEAQENAVSSIEALLGAALPEGYTIEVSSAAQNQTTE